jgi:hypothetical protein
MFILGSSLNPGIIAVRKGPEAKPVLPDTYFMEAHTNIAC